MEFRVQKPSVLVQKVLSDMPSFVHYHPLLHKIEPLGPDLFRVHERAPLFWGLSLPISYKARVIRSPDRAQISYEAWPQGMELHLHFRLIGRDGGTLVQEKARAKGFGFFLDVLEKALRQSHEELFRRMSEDQELTN